MCNVAKKKRTVKFCPKVDTFEVPLQEELHGIHPRHYLLTGPIGNISILRINMTQDPFTGLHRDEQAQLKRSWKPCVASRENKLRETLITGAAWETSTPAIIAALEKLSSKQRKKAKPKYLTRKRVGCRQAKSHEQ